jgi:hypothetical protein
MCPPIRMFILTSGVILAISATAKIVSAFGNAGVLASPDPVFKVAYRYVFLAVGTVELIVAILSFASKRIRSLLLLIAWVATCCAVYRFGLILIQYEKPCICLGTLTEALHISPGSADAGLQIALLYMMAGSYWGLWYLWRTEKKGAACAPVTASAM